MESKPVTCSRSFLVIVIAIMVAAGSYGIYYVMQIPVVDPTISINKTNEITLISNSTMEMTEEGGHISGILKGPVIVNITGNE